MEVAKGSSGRAQSHKPLSSLRASADQHSSEVSHIAKHRVKGTTELNGKEGGSKEE